MLLGKSHLLVILVGLLVWLGLFSLAFGQECDGTDESPCNVAIVNGQACPDERTRDPEDDCFIPIVCEECRTDGECEALCD